MTKQEHKGENVGGAAITSTIGVEALPSAHATFIALKCSHTQPLRPFCDALEAIMDTRPCASAWNVESWAQAACVAIHSPKNVAISAPFAFGSLLHDVPRALVTVRAAVVFTTAATKLFGQAALA